MTTIEKQLQRAEAAVETMIWSPAPAPADAEAVRLRARMWHGTAPKPQSGWRADQQQASAVVVEYDHPEATDGRACDGTVTLPRMAGLGGAVLVHMTEGLAARARDLAAMNGSAPSEDGN